MLVGSGLPRVGAAAGSCVWVPVGSAVAPALPRGSIERRRTCTRWWPRGGWEGPVSLVKPKARDAAQRRDDMAHRRDGSPPDPSAGAQHGFVGRTGTEPRCCRIIAEVLLRRHRAGAAEPQQTGPSDVAPQGAPGGRHPGVWMTPAPGNPWGFLEIGPKSRIWGCSMPSRGA